MGMFDSKKSNETAEPLETEVDAKIEYTDEQLEEQFRAFIEAQDIDFDSPAIDENDGRDRENLKHTFKRAMKRGRLELNDDLCPVYTCKTGRKITFKEPDGIMWSVTDKQKPNASVAKMYASMGVCTGEAPAMLKKLPARDLKVLMAIWSLFLI